MFLHEAQDEGYNREAVTSTKDGRIHSCFHQPDGSYYYEQYFPFRLGYTAPTLEELRTYLRTLKGDVPSLYEDCWMPRLSLWKEEK